LSDELLSATDYLQERIAQDGPWGIMLAQNGGTPGIVRYRNRTVDQITADTNGRLLFDDVIRDNVDPLAVDRMGVFEWLALTLQFTPDTQAEDSISLLLANNIEEDGSRFVGGGSWRRLDQKCVRTSMVASNQLLGKSYPRLAVL
jgi:hypothetical protein